MLVNKYAGFTLVEVLITISIISILTVIAAPSFITFIKRDRLVTNANQLHSVFKFARSEAIKRDQTVHLSSSNKQWLATTEVDAQQQTLNTFTITHSTITVVLNDIDISNTGELNSTYEYLVTDSDDSTNDFRLCILQSGQSWLAEAPEVC